MGSNPIGPTNAAEPGTGAGPGAAWPELADNHVHSQWSHDTGPDASMARACARAVALGLPAVAFTEHLDFTEAGPGDPIAAAGLVPNAAAGIRPLDVPGYLTALAECRDRYPALRILSGVEAGEPHLFAASAAAVLGSGQFDRVLGSVHALPSAGQLVYSGWLLRREPPDEVMRRYFAEVVAMIEGSGVFEVLAHLDFPRRYWPASAGEYAESAFEAEYRAVFRALARLRPGARAEHGQSAALGQPAALVGRGGRHRAVLRQRRAPALACRRPVPGRVRDRRRGRLPAGPGPGSTSGAAPAASPRPGR